MIDRMMYVFVLSKFEKLKIYCMVFNMISVEKMNVILFDDLIIVCSLKSGVIIYNNNIGVVNYNDKNEKYYYKNLFEDEVSFSKMEEMILGIFDFINGYGGFLNEDFRLFSMNN